MRDQMVYRLVSNSEEDTKELGRKLAGILPSGSVIALDGDLGAGKTVFTKGFCEGAGVTSRVTSPTFTIVNEYIGGRFPVYHFDTYRLEGPDDFLDSGLDDYFYQDGICVIEWSSVIGELLPPKTLRIFIRGTGTSRDIEILFEKEGFGEEITDRLCDMLTR